MTRRADLPIGQIVDMLEERLERLVFEFWPAAEKHGSVIYPSPGKGDLGSFQVFLASHGKQTAGRWVRYSQRRGGNVLNLIAYALSGETEHKPASYGPAVEWAKQWLGLDRPETDAERRRREERTERRRAEAERKAAHAERRKREHVAEIWCGAEPVDPTDEISPVVHYLTGEPVWKGGRNVGNRGLDLAGVPHFVAPLRFHPHLAHWRAGWTGPAQVLGVMNRRGEVTAVHCTWLAPDGIGKARLGRFPPKMMRGDVEGCFVPVTLGPTGLSLSASAKAGRRSPILFVEGFETSVALAGGGAEARTWAALSLSNIGALAWAARHDAVSAVVHAVENDVAPQAIRERERVHELLEAAGKPLFEMRSHVGSDFADLY